MVVNTVRERGSALIGVVGQSPVAVYIDRGDSAEAQ